MNIGESVYPVSAEEKNIYASISKIKTSAPHLGPGLPVRPALPEPGVRLHQGEALQPGPRKIFAMLKKQDFDMAAAEVKLSRPSSYPMELCAILLELFDALFQPAHLYRATGIVLVDLGADVPVQYTLFEDAVRGERVREVYDAADLHPALPHFRGHVIP